MIPNPRKTKNTPIYSGVTNPANKTNNSAKPIQAALKYCVTDLSEASTADTNTAFQILVYFYTQRYSLAFMTFGRIFQKNSVIFGLASTVLNFVKFEPSQIFLILVHFGNGNWFRMKNNGNVKAYSS